MTLYLNYQLKLYENLIYIYIIFKISIHDLGKFQFMNFKFSIDDSWKFQFMKIFGYFYNFVRLTVLIIVSLKNNIQHHIKYIHRKFYING